jgi:hypothetical protein
LEIINERIGIWGTVIEKSLMGEEQEVNVFESTISFDEPI